MKTDETGVDGKYKFLAINLLFALTVTISAILFGSKSNFWALMGYADHDKFFEGLLVTVAFLVAWLLYGIVMGYTKKKGFMKFISLYWGIGGSICLAAALMAPIGKFAIIVIPVGLLVLVPTYGFVYYHLPNSLLAIISITSSWSAGAIGYLLGYLLKKLRVKHVAE